VEGGLDLKSQDYRWTRLNESAVAVAIDRWDMEDKDRRTKSIPLSARWNGHQRKKVIHTAIPTIEIFQ
jgi:hypothetical protein